MLRPSRKQRFIASGWLTLSFRIAFSLACVIWAVSTIELPLIGLDNIWALLLFALVIAVPFVAGWFASYIICLGLVGPVLLAQSRENGGPFLIGDTVQIIGGKHSGRVTKIYSKSQNDTNRLELGLDAEEQFKDIYAGYQLLRVDTSKQSTGEA